MPYSSKEQRSLYMRSYRKKHKRVPLVVEGTLTVNPYEGLETLLGHPIVVCTKHGIAHVHLSKEAIEKIEANTEYGKKVR